MKFRITLSVAVGLCLIGCSQTTPNSDNQKAYERPVNSLTSHGGSVLASIDELDEEQYDDVFSLSDDLAFVFNDEDGDYDSATVKNNQQIKSRATDSVSINATGVSLLSQRTDYDITLAEVMSYRLYEYDAVSSLRTKRSRYNSPGVDLIWFNEDDDVQDYTAYDTMVGTLQTLMIRYNGPGVDAIWFTEDDDVQRYEAEILDADGLAVATARYNGPGLDLLWFTADDDVQFATAESTNADGNLQWIQYNDPGVDMDWATLADNTVGHFSATILNVDSLAIQHIFYLDSGVDLAPFTADDNLMYYHSYTYNPANLNTNSLRYNDPGIDMEWLTADDVIRSCDEISYNVDDAVEQEVMTTVGTDSLCFTGDDLTAQYEVNTYDDMGHLIGRNRFEDAGVDTNWFTEDDVLSREYIYTVQ